ncbi:MAG TPA: NUDIX hydrolase [Patescibacteria group bacterium]|nr:NUDIX hydrolase [Patescibacteria group bacterium]
MKKDQRFHFCPRCGARLVYRPVKDQQRLVCNACAKIFYENPVVGVAAIVMKTISGVPTLLLGRRSEDSSYGGLWCIPCGYVEYDEDVYAAVKRELFEETGLEIEVDRVYTVLSNFHNPASHTVGIWFMARATGGCLNAGDDLDRVAYFPLDQLPPLAFPTDVQVTDQLRRANADNK